MTGPLWGDRPEGTRGPRATLTLDGIAAAGIALADAQGLGGVSMQHVAAQLGVTKMALYRYLPGKRDLVALILERALGAPPDLEAEDWRAGLRTWAHALLAAHLRHPWSVEAALQSRPVGPHELDWMEGAVALLAGTGLSGPERLDVLAALTGQVRVIAQQTRAPGSHRESFVDAVSTVLAQRADQFPTLAEAFAEAGRTSQDDRAFDFGLELILDGLAGMVQARAGSLTEHPDPARA